MPVTGDVPPLLKPAVVTDEQCLPWSLSALGDSTSNIKTLKVPSKARHEYQKACDAGHKKNFPEAEQHARAALEKFNNYPAAWVILGVVLDEQQKRQEARDACSQAVAIDGKYLPGYLCAAEFSARNREWERLLELANTALDLNAETDGYAHYYRAMACLYLHKFADAQKSALHAAEIDAKHNYVPLYILLAQISEAKGDKAAAAAQLREILKTHSDDVAKRYLAQLEAEPAAPAAKKPDVTENENFTDGLADDSTASLADLPKIDDTWIPEDIDRAVPTVASGVECPLQAVLDGAGRRIDELVHNVDRFMATENLIHQPVDRSGQMGSPITARFNYLVSYTEDSTGYLKVDEFRDGSLSIEPFPSHIATIGTPSLVLIFHPRYAGNFKMVCEGLGQLHGEPAWQIRFEQRADRPNLTYSFTVNRMTYSVNLRGRAWILADSFQVARLDTDLVQAIPQIRLRMDHQSVEYRPVESSANHLKLWLPSSTELYMDFLGRRFYRKHSFTDFKIFSVDTHYQIAAPKEKEGAAVP